MLKIFTREQLLLLDIDDYCITEKYNGLDELEFNISIYDKNFYAITEETCMLEEQYYVVKAVDAGTKTAKVKCKLDIDDLRSELFLNYSNNEDTVYNTLHNILPENWQLIDLTENNLRLLIQMESATVYDIINECLTAYDISVKYDNVSRTLTLIDSKNSIPKGAFLTTELNLTELNYKGKSDEFATRLYAQGKDDLTFADINNGKIYVDDHTYSERIIAVYWKDENYTDKNSLLKDAKKQLAAIAKPQRSYTCNILDLAKTNPETYSNQDFSLHNIVTLIDSDRKIRINYEVVEYQRWPYYPERNIVTLSTVTPSIQNTVKQIQSEIKNPSSKFRTSLQLAIDKATELITGGLGGNIVINKAADGHPNELLIMDTKNKESAKNVLRINMHGIGFSQSGYNGPFDTAWTLDGHFNASYITTGVFDARLIKTGILQSKDGKCWIDLDTGEFQLITSGGDSIETEIEKLNHNGQMIVVIKASKGTALSRNNLSTMLTASVYQYGKDITSELRPDCFEWTKCSADNAADRIWNENHRGVGNQVEITVNDIYQFGTIDCNIIMEERIYNGN